MPSEIIEPDNPPAYAEHVNDPTHPAGNKELAEEMAYAGYKDESLAAKRRENLNLIKSDGLHGLVYEQEQMVSAAEKNADLKEETVRAEYLEEHPELAAGDVISEEENGQAEQAEDVGDVAVSASVDSPEKEVGEETKTEDKLSRLRTEIIQLARTAESQSDHTGRIGEQKAMHDLEALLRAGDKDAIDKAVSILEDPKSERYNPRGYESIDNKMLAYRDLAIAAYESGLIDEAEELGSRVTRESYIVPLLFAKAEALESAVPELLESAGRNGVYDGRLRSLAVRHVNNGNFEQAKMIADSLQDKDRFDVLAKLVEAGDKDQTLEARESALNLRKELGGGLKKGEGYTAEEYRIRALLRLHDAGDEEALNAALNIAREAEDWHKVQVLGWLGSEIAKRETHQEAKLAV